MVFANVELSLFDFDVNFENKFLTILILPLAYYFVHLYYTADEDEILISYRYN